MKVLFEGDQEQELHYFYLQQTFRKNSKYVSTFINNNYVLYWPSKQCRVIYTKT